MPFAERKRPSQALRALVAYDQDYKCAKCSSTLPPGWHLDHIVPLCDPSWAETCATKAEATKQANAQNNLQALCPNCHCQKSLIESSEPALAVPQKPKVKGIPWEAARARRRQKIDAIWALSSHRDMLNDLLTSDKMWTELMQARTERAMRKLHRNVERQGRRIDYAAFRKRVDHLLAS
jgi:5-methylcytosine-specific restriction endonuclease McrA